MTPQNKLDIHALADEVRQFNIAARETERWHRELEAKIAAFKSGTPQDGIARHWQEQRREEFEALASFEQQMTREDAEWLKEMNVAP